MCLYHNTVFVLKVDQASCLTSEAGSLEYFRATLRRLIYEVSLYRKRDISVPLSIL
jgi:hypothetical protein